MIAESFVIAMFAEIAFGAYEEPFRIKNRANDWLIVSRWGLDAEYLTISRTETPSAVRNGAPIGLTPRATFFGLLSPVHPAGVDSLFLLVRRLPPGITVAGAFLPSDGFACLSGAGKPQLLAAAGRYAHSLGHTGAGELRGDVPDPPPAADHALAWHMTAERRPWIGEVPN